jgi:hypothetical protein
LQIYQLIQKTPATAGVFSL